MRLLLQPTIASLRNDYDLNDFADEEQFNEELLVRQGFEAEEIDVKDGEEFEIPEGMCASVIENEEDPTGEFEFDEEKEEAYKLYAEVEDGVWDEEPIRENLQAGLYKLDEHLVKVIRLYDEE